MLNWRQKHQKYRGRVVLHGDIVKDNSGSYAVFTEQGSSASQMTAAKIMDIISRLPGCDGQAADAVSAYTQVKMEDAHKLLKIPKSECPDIWIRLPPLKCEGDGDVVGVVARLRGVAQVVLHGVQVVEVGVRLMVHQDRGVEEDGEGQVEVEREEGEVKERRSCMKMG